MRVLVIGSGGREHALVWKISQSKLVDKIFCAPGNAGIMQEAECLAIKADDIESLLDFARKEKMDLTVVGPETPLSEGIVDEFTNYRLRIFGPNRKAARIESSKAFTKELMAKYDVPTADFRIFDNPAEAKDYIEEKGVPCVVKADGLAQGKGVFVANSLEEAREAVTSIMERKIFAGAGKKIIVEDFLEGEEASIIVITDSKEIIPFASSQDHKRVFDGDRGRNTGGMGAYSPAPVVTQKLFKEVLDKIIYRTVNGLLNEGIDYSGVLYAGIMITKEGPKLLEFNVRFGDPETQVILPRLEADLAELMFAATDKKLAKLKRLKWDERACVCVVLASGGYPGAYQKGKTISGLEEARQMTDVIVFHAGTKRAPVTSHQSPVGYLTNGGRVLGLTALGDSIKEAINKTYRAVEKIHFEGMHYRKDIGAGALKNQKSNIKNQKL